MVKVCGVRGKVFGFCDTQSARIMISGDPGYPDSAWDSGGKNHLIFSVKLKQFLRILAHFAFRYPDLLLLFMAPGTR